MKNFEMPRLKISTFSGENVVTASNAADIAIEEYRQQYSDAHVKEISYEAFKLVY